MNNQQIMYNESHLYPCQIQLLNQNMNKNGKFAIYSPLNHYGTIFNCDNSITDYFDLGQSNYRMKNFNQSQSFYFQKDNQLKFFTKKLSQEDLCDEFYDSESFSLPQSHQIISNILQLPKSYYRNDYLDSQQSSYQMSESYRNMKFCYLSYKEDKQNPPSGIKIHFFNNSLEKDLLNPQKMQIQCQQKINNKMGSFDQKEGTSINIKYLPQLQFHKDQFQLYCPFQNNQLFIFDKKQSRLLEIDLQQQGRIWNSILCNFDSVHSYNNNFNHNKISFLSKNIILNYGKNGLIKLIDKRMNRIMQIRDLNEQNNQMNDNISHQIQENYIKYYNNQRSMLKDTNKANQNNFFINKGNKIIQVDLRMRNRNQQIVMFQFNKSKKQNIGNYQMKINDKKQKYVSFTTEGHSQFKAYVVKEFKSI